MKTKILLVEDDEDIAEIIKMQCELAGYKIHVEHDGINALRAITKDKPELIILDIMLPGLNGLDVCRKVKNNPETKGIPVIVISAKSEEVDVVLGLELGADDYVSKPFSVKVLMSRIRAVLRRGKEPETAAKTIVFGPFTLDLDGYQLHKKGKLIPLTRSEFNILKRMLSNRGKVLSRNQLLDEIAGDDVFIVDRNIDVHVAALRRKLGSSSGIETVRGVGYRFTDEE